METLEDSESDDGIECELELLDVEKEEEQSSREEMAALQVWVDTDTKRAVEATEELEELEGSETGRDDEEEEVSDT